MISIFNGIIPLIALQMNAVQNGDEITLNFVKVLDRNDIQNDDENEVDPADRKYWEGQSNILKFMDAIFSEVSDIIPGYELKYTKFYVGIARDGVASNFIKFRPKKKHMYLFIRLPETEETNIMLDQGKLDYDYTGRERAYRIKITQIKEFEENKERIRELVQRAANNKDG